MYRQPVFLGDIPGLGAIGIHLLLDFATSMIHGHTRLCFVFALSPGLGASLRLVPAQVRDRESIERPSGKPASGAAPYAWS